MKRLRLILFILFTLSQISFASTDSIKFAVIRLDYLTYSLKHIYYFQQPYQPSPPPMYGRTCGKLYVTIEATMDSGGTTIRSIETGEVVYEATTVRAGSGEHIFPTPEFQIYPGYSGLENTSPAYFDIVDHFFHGNDSTRTDTVWNIAQHVAPLSLFSTEKFGVLIYVHYFSLGIGNPATAEIIIIFYTLSQASSGRWVDISGDLPNWHVNSIAPHPFYTDSLFIGTDAGAFQTCDGGKHWRLMKFDENPSVKITQIIAEVHPILDWTIPVLWLGTEEYTMIPEDRLGRIFFSENGGLQWKNTYFPKIAVSAVEVPYDSSLVAFAAAYNPFYNQDGFFVMDDTGWVEYDLTPDDSIAIRINCIEVDEANPNRMFLATSNGVYSTTDWGINWTNSGSHHNSPWIVLPPQYPEIVYAILLGGTRSEGIYRSKDYGQYWERVCWTVNAVTFIPDYATPGVWYEAIKNLGVFKSIDDCSTWTDISNGLQEKDILCLVQDRRNPMVLYAGTTNGIFRYEGSATSVNFSDKNAIQNKPKKFELFTAYPNPFNSNVQIGYQVNMNMAHVKLEIYNMLGQCVKVLADNVQSRGDYLIQWDGRNEFGQMSASGIYFCMLQLNNNTTNTLKLLLIQ